MLKITALLFTVFMVLVACRNESEVADWTRTQVWDVEDRQRILVCDDKGDCKRPLSSTDGYSN